MAKKTEFEGEKLDMDELDKVVAGAGALGALEKDEDEAKKRTTVIDNLSGNETKPMLGIGLGPTGGGFFPSGGGIFDNQPGPTGGGFIMDITTRAPNEVLNDIAKQIATDVAARMSSVTTPDDARRALDRVVNEYASRLGTEMKVDHDTAGALAWSSTYKAVYDNGSSGAGAEAMKSYVASHVQDVAKGMAVEVGVVGDLKGSLSRTSDVIAQSIKGASETAAEEIKTKAVAAYELGLQKAKETGVGKSVMAAIDDPKNIDNWKQVMANGAWLVESPTWVTPTKFLLEQMASQATAKAIGLSDFPSEMKQTASALVNTLDKVEKAFVDIYSTGFLAGMTMGLDVKGIINIGANVADLGKAMWSGDAGAMKDAAQALVTDVFNDVKEGLKNYYVTAPTKAFEWTKNLTMGLLDDLGGTKYAEIAVQETGKAFVDFGNLAKDGCVGAVNTIADFAKHDVVGAVNTVADLARSGVNGAMNALEDVAKKGVNGAVSALGDLARSGVGGSIESMARVIVAGVPGALAEMTAAAKTVENAMWTVRKAAEQGSQAALNAVENIAKTAAGNIQRIAVDGVQQAIVHGVPGAANKLADLVSQGVPFARDSAQHLMNEGKAAGQAVYNELKGAYGKAADATAAVEWAAKYAYNDVGKAAVNEIERVAKQGGAYANVAINGLADVVKAGGSYANQAVDALKSLSGTSEVAKRALEDAAHTVGGAAETAWSEVEKAARSVLDKLNPRNWWPW